MTDQPELDGTEASVFAADESRIVIDFAVGPAGVGPVTGFESGEFFPGPAVDSVPELEDTEPQ